MSITVRNTAMKFIQILPIHGEVLFTRAPRWRTPSTMGLQSQRLGWDSDGAPYVYSKTKMAQAKHQLEWPRQPGSVLLALKSFIGFCNGNKRTFGYIDFTGKWHYVKYKSGSLSWSRVGIEMYSIRIELIEEEISTVVTYPDTGAPIVTSGGADIPDGSGAAIL